MRKLSREFINGYGVFFISVLLLQSCSAPGSSIPLENLNVDSSMEWAADDFLQDQRFKSVSIATYSEGAEYTRYFGSLNAEGWDEPDDHTLYELGSVSKLFNGILTAQAVLDGVVNLDDDVRTYLSETPINGTFDNLSYKVNRFIFAIY